VSYRPAVTLVRDEKTDLLADFHMILNEYLELHKLPSIEQIPAELEIKSGVNTGGLTVSQLVSCVSVCCLKS
jgi:hypothetical protein